MPTKRKKKTPSSSSERPILRYTPVTAKPILCYVPAREEIVVRMLYSNGVLETPIVTYPVTGEKDARARFPEAFKSPPFGEMPSASKLASSELRGVFERSQKTAKELGSGCVVSFEVSEEDYAKLEQAIKSGQLEEVKFVESNDSKETFLYDEVGRIVRARTVFAVNREETPYDELVSFRGWKVKDEAEARERYPAAFGGTLGDAPIELFLHCNSTIRNVASFLRQAAADLERGETRGRHRFPPVVHVVDCCESVGSWTTRNL